MSVKGGANILKALVLIDNWSMSPHSGLINCHNKSCPLKLIKLGVDFEINPW